MYSVILFLVFCIFYFYKDLLRINYNCINYIYYGNPIQDIKTTFVKQLITIPYFNNKINSKTSEFNYSIEQLEVKKYGDIHQLSGSLKHSGGGELTLVTEVFGDPSLDDSYSEVYIEATDIEIADCHFQK